MKMTSFAKDLSGALRFEAARLRGLGAGQASLHRATRLEAIARGIARSDGVRTQLSEVEFRALWIADIDLVAEALRTLDEAERTYADWPVSRWLLAWSHDLNQLVRTRWPATNVVVD